LNAVLEQRQNAKREQHLISTNIRPLAEVLASRIYLANRHGFPSATLNTPDNGRTNENPQTPYNNLGIILETLEYPSVAFGQALTIRLRLAISRDDWKAYKHQMSAEMLEVVNDYLTREPTPDAKTPKLEHPVFFKTRQTWCKIFEDFQARDWANIKIVTKLILDNQSQYPYFDKV
jgi:hypothetical protein